MGEMTKFRFSPDETGWAESLGDGKYRIANIPLNPSLNLNDVVRGVENPRTGWIEVKELLQRPLNVKMYLSYSCDRDIENITLFIKEAEEREFHIEGMVPGYLSVAFHEDPDTEECEKESELRQLCKKFSVDIDPNF